MSCFEYTTMMEIYLLIWLFSFRTAYSDQVLLKSCKYEALAFFHTTLGNYICNISKDMLLVQNVQTSAILKLGS